MVSSQQDPASDNTTVGPDASRLAGVSCGIASFLFVLIAILRATDGESISSMVAIATVLGGVSLVFLSKARQAKGKE